MDLRSFVRMAIIPPIQLGRSSRHASIVCRTVLPRTRGRTIKRGTSVSVKPFIHLKDHVLTANKLDNLRYAFNACIYGAANSTDPINSPCSLDTACAPIQGAMRDGMGNPATLQEYSYCSAYDNSFLGQFLGACGTCLTETTTEVIFSNCMIPPRSRSIGNRY